MCTLLLGGLQSITTMLISTARIPSMFEDVISCEVSLMSRNLLSYEYHASMQDTPGHRTSQNIVGYSVPRVFCEVAVSGAYPG